MNILLTNPWVFLLAIVWAVCGLSAAACKSHKPLNIAGQFSLALGIFYLIVKHIL